MVGWIVSGGLRSRGLVVALAIGVMAIGITQLQNMPQDVLPEFSPTTVEVQTEALGLSAPEIEQLITVPLEQDLLNGVAFLDTIRSESVPGLSRIEMIFEPGTPLADARQVVNERLTQAHALPNVSKPPQMLQPMSSSARVMMIGLSSEDLSLIDLSLLARWTMRPQLLGVPGVANVSIWGQREQQLQVQVDPERLRAEGVSLEQVLATTGNSLWVSPLTFLEASTPGTGGFFDTPTQRIGVQHVQPIRTPEDLAQVPLEAAAGSPDETGPTPRLGDVADIVQDHQPLIGDAVLTGGPGLVLVVDKLPESNALQVTEDLDSVLAEMGPGLEGVDVDASLFRPARYIDASTDNLRTALIVVAVLAALALGLLLFDLRLALVGLISMLLSLATAVIIVEALGQSLNPMVLGGLVLSLLVLVDDAVVSAESIRRGLSAGGAAPEPGPGSLRRLAASVVPIRRQLASATVILLVALVPVFVLNGEMGAFVPPIALAYGAAVLASVLVASVVSPALASLLLRPGTHVRDTPPIAGWLGPRYDRTLARITGPRPPAASGRTFHGGLSALASVAVLVALGAVLLPFVDRGDSLVPELEDRDVLVQWEGAPGTSLPEMSRITSRAARELEAQPGVAHVGAHVGRAVTADQIVGVSSGQMWVTIGASADYDATFAAIEDVVSGYPGIESSVLTYGRGRIHDVLVEPEGMPGADLTLRLFGQDLDVLDEQGEVLQELIGGLDGVSGSTAETVVEEPALEVVVDLDAAQRVGIKPGDVRRTAATLISGIEVGNLFEEQKVFEVVVQGVPGVRHSVDDLRDLLLEAPDGTALPLGEVADVRIAPSPNVIRHVDVSRSLDIGIDVEDRSVAEVASDLDALIAETRLPFEYHAEVLGDHQDRREARVTFIGVLLAAALGVYLLLQATFQSWRVAGLVFLVIPASLTGGVVATLVDGGQITIGHLLGFVAVLGLTVRMSILLVRRAQEGEGDGARPALVARVAHERLAALVTTTATAALIFVPLLFFGGRAGHELVHPMAVVVTGGLVTAALVQLFALPALYLRFGRPASSRESFDRELERLAVAGPDDPGEPTTTDLQEDL